MWVGRRRVDEHRVEGQRPTREQPWDIGQEDRDVVRPTLVDRGARIRPDEQGAVPEVALHAGRHMRARPLGVEVDHCDVVQFLRPGDQAVEEDRRGRGRAVQVDLITGADGGRGFGGCDESHHPTSLPGHGPSNAMVADMGVNSFVTIVPGGAGGVARAVGRCSG